MRRLLLVVLIALSFDAFAQRRRAANPPEPATDGLKLPLCGPTDGWGSKDYGPWRIWWQDKAYEERAHRLGEHLLDVKVWDKVVAFMGDRQPLSDAGVPCSEKTGKGMDGLFDIYITRGVDTYTRPSTTNCESTPAYIRLAPNTDDRTIAHEFAHAVQLAYSWKIDGCLTTNPQLSILAEATGATARAVVYEKDPRYHEKTKQYYEEISRPFDRPETLTRATSATRDGFCRSTCTAPAATSERSGARWRARARSRTRWSAPSRGPLSGTTSPARPSTSGHGTSSRRGKTSTRRWSRRNAS